MSAHDDGGPARELERQLEAEVSAARIAALEMHVPRLEEAGDMLMDESHPTIFCNKGCPGCGAGEVVYGVPLYTCGTTIEAWELNRTTVCREIEVGALRKRIAALEAHVARIGSSVAEKFGRTRIEMLNAETERTDARLQHEIGKRDKRIAQLEAHVARLHNSLDTLVAVVGLTPVKGNLESLQEAMDDAVKTLKAKEAKP